MTTSKKARGKGAVKKGEAQAPEPETPSLVGPGDRGPHSVPDFGDDPKLGVVVTVAAPTVGGGDVYISPLAFGDNNRRSLMRVCGPVPGEAFFRALVEHPTDTVGGLIEVPDWAARERQLVADLLHACESQDEAAQNTAKARLPGFVPAHFDPDCDGRRTKERCIGRQVIGHDFDHIYATDWDDAKRQIVVLLPGRFLAIHTTPRSTARVWRVRAYELLNREATPAEWEARVKPHMREMGCTDTNALDVTRFFYLPVLTSNYRYAIIEGPRTQLDDLPPAANAPTPVAAPAAAARTAAPAGTLATEHRTIDPSSPAGVRAISLVKDYLASAEPAIEGQGGSNRLFAVCCRLMYSALPLDVLRQLVEEVYNPRCEPPWSQQEIDHKLVDADRISKEPRGYCSQGFIDKMYGRTTQTGAKEPDPLHEYTFKVGMRGSGDARRASIGEVAADLFDHVAWAGVLRFNTFRNRVIAVNPPMKMQAETPSGLSDNDVQLVRVWLEYNGKKCNTLDVRAAIEAVARQDAFHPLQAWLRSLQWDGKPRLDRVLLDYFQAPDGPYERAIGPRWFISLVARAMVPGCQSDCTLILEGKQGIGKTSAFRALMHDLNWYAESSCGVDHKDFYENLRGVWLMGFDELDSLTRSSITKVNTELTKLCDHYRPSYGRYSEDYARSTGFCGSTNAEVYLPDSTGGRRFWPVKVLREIDRKRIEDDRDQLWAEAFVRYCSGEEWHINTPELLALCEAEQEARYEVDGWEEKIQRWFHDPTKFSHTPIATDPRSVFHGIQPFDGSQGVTTADVLEHAIGKLKGQWTTGDAMRVGRILQRLQMKRKQIWLGTFDGKARRERRYQF